MSLPEIAPPSESSPCCVCGEPITSFDSYGVGKAISHRYHWTCVKREAATVSPDYEAKIAALGAKLAERDQQIVMLADQADKYDILHRKAIAKTEEARTALQASRDDFLLVTEQLAAAIKDNDEKERLLVEAGYRVAELEANQTFAGWRDAVLREREHVARVEGERNHLYSALEDIANMPEYDQDDAHRLRHKAANAIKQPHTSPMTAAPAHSDIVWPMHERPNKPKP